MANLLFWTSIAVTIASGTSQIIYLSPNPTYVSPSPSVQPEQGFDYLAIFLGTGLGLGLGLTLLGLLLLFLCLCAWQAGLCAEWGFDVFICRLLGWSLNLIGADPCRSGLRGKLARFFESWRPEGCCGRHGSRPGQHCVMPHPMGPALNMNLYPMPQCCFPDIIVPPSSPCGSPHIPVGYMPVMPMMVA